MQIQSDNNGSLRKDDNPKIKIETSADLYKLPPSVIRNTKLYDFQGKYFDRIYEEALKIERSGGLEKYSLNSVLSSSKKDKTVTISSMIFEMTYQTQMGQELGVIGSVNPLGNWNQDNALRMQWTEGNKWVKQIPLENNTLLSLEFKFIFIVNNKVQKWEDGDNRSFNLIEIKKLIEDNMKEEYSDVIRIDNIKHMSYVYDVKDNSIKIIANWNKK